MRRERYTTRKSGTMANGVQSPIGQNKCTDDQDKQCELPEARLALSTTRETEDPSRWGAGRFLGIQREPKKTKMVRGGNNKRKI